MQYLKTIRNLACVVTSLLVVLMSGCSEEVVVKRMKPAPQAAVELQSVEDITDALAQFDPPFPERTVLFEPDKKMRSEAGNTARRATGNTTVDNQSVPEIELVGFGTVDAEHALLMIDGRMEALRVGEQHRNVRVLRIEPPRVKLSVAGRVREKTLLSNQDG